MFENIYLNLVETYKISTETAKRLRNYYGSEVFEILGDSPKELKKGLEYYEEEIKHFINLFLNLI
jgi:glycerol-3-phosphate dehydrogenase